MVSSEVLSKQCCLKGAPSNSGEEFWGKKTISLNRQTCNFCITPENYLKLKSVKTTCLRGFF